MAASASTTRPIGLIDIVKKKLRRLSLPVDRDGEAQDEYKP